jgi:hypothetical protein
MSQARAKIAANEAKIAKLQAENLELAAAAENEIDMSKVVAGARVQFNYGRPAKALVGVIKGVKVPAEGQKGGTIVRIEVGEGADADIVSVFPSAITGFSQE